MPLHGIFWWMIFSLIAHNKSSILVDKSPHSFYLHAMGDDANEGSKNKPWKTINRLNKEILQAGDTVFFESGQLFPGTILIDKNEVGSHKKSIVLTSTGKRKAVIDGGNESGCIVDQSAYIHIRQLTFKGSGRKSGNTKNGVNINNSNHIVIDSINTSGFQKSGLLIQSSHYVKANRIYAYENGFAGIFVNGTYNTKTDCSNIVISHSKAENNPGDPTNITNHSGNGILAGFCKNIIIEYCSATNNGWDMPRQGNGPVGIWTYESDSVVIQHCIAYRNRTSDGGNDGGGFDLDGGVTNSIIQYCLSYENEGSGYGLFQYDGASNWNDNIVRFNISENDGMKTAKCAGILIWNSSGDSQQLRNCLVYNNTIYNTQAPAIVYAADSEHQQFNFYNNIFVVKDSIVSGKQSGDYFENNNWYSLTGWLMTETNLQSVNGFNIDPVFKQPGKAAITDPVQLHAFNNYQLHRHSVLKTKGIDLSKKYKIHSGGKTFNQTPASPKGMGACY